MRKHSKYINFFFCCPGFMSSKITSPDDEITSLLLPNGGGVWQCAACSKQGNKGDIKRHIEAKHMLNTEINCQICGKSTKTRDSLRKHMKNHHDGVIWH